MGMFDEITVPTHLLPAPLPKFFQDDDEHIFQTKDFNNLLDNYIIHDDGSLSVVNWVEGKSSEPTIVKHHGDVYIYSSNMCAGGPLNGEYIQYTHDGSDAESVDYTVKFTNGKVESIVKDGYDRKPARHRKHLSADWKEESERKEAAVRKRAFAIYEQRVQSGTVGNEVSDWVTAEKEIKEEEWQSWLKKQNH